MHRSRRPGRFVVPLALLAVGLAALLPAAAAARSGIAKVSPDGQVTRYDVGAAGRFELGPLAAGPDGNVWVVAKRDDYWNPKPSMLRISPAGGVTPFPLGTDSDVHIAGLAAGADGNVWFTEGHASRVAPESAGVGRITPSGAVTEFSTGLSFCNPRGIAAGPDGALWMTDWGGDRVIRVTTAGELTSSFAIPELSSAWGITAGPDGNLWFAELGHDRVARISPDGALTEFPTSERAGPTEIAAGPDGRLWFAHAYGRSVGRVTTAGSVDQIPLSMEVDDVAAGADGNVYVSGTGTYGSAEIGRLLRISPAGNVADVPIGPCSFPEELATGPDGNVWFVEGNASGCTPNSVVFSRHGTISRRGVARVLLWCMGGDPKAPCHDVSFKMTAVARYPTTGRHGQRVWRERTVTVGTVRGVTIGGAPRRVGRELLARVPLTRAGRELLAGSSSGRIHVDGRITLGSVSRSSRMLLTGPAPRPARRAVVRP